MTVEQLRNSLLQEAISGRLVPQDPNDEPATTILSHINAEKKRLVKIGNLKKYKDPASIAETEVPYEVPLSWQWVRLSTLCTLITKGTTPRGGNVAYIGEGIGFLRAENVSGIDRLDLSNLKYIDKTTNDGYLKRSILQENDLLITIAGTLGRTAIVRKEDLPLNANQAVCLCRWVDVSSISLKYIAYALNAPAIQSMMLSLKKITAIPNLTLEIISDTIIPFPPLAEQKRIVAKLEELLPIVEEYGKAQKELKDLNIELPTRLRQSVLQEAITGKLVPQNHTEESASSKLEKIKSINTKLFKEGKIKKKYKEVVILSPTEEDFSVENWKENGNILQLSNYTLPEGWAWCQLKSICWDFIVPQRDKPKRFDGDIPWCRIEDMQGKYFDGSLSGQNVSMDLIKEMNMHICPAGTVICACSASIGNQAITLRDCCTNQTFIGLHCNEHVLYNEYLYYFLAAIAKTLKELGRGTTIKYISREKFENMLIPLPPLEEQKRIVAKLEEILPQIDKLAKL